MQTILVAREKHGDRYFDASTPELLAAASLKLLRERMKEGWYVKPDSVNTGFTKEQKAFLELTDEDIEALPAVVREETHKKVLALREKAERLRSFDAEEMQWYTQVEALLALPTEKAANRTITQGKGTRWERSYPKAFYLLNARDDAEYEGVEVVTLEAAG